jgi:sterol desaturase/sphingolipid hydroxylase (fatty acid hydroxylase superfamily)
MSSQLAKSAALLAWMAFLVWLEKKRSLRRTVEPKLPHDLRNLVIAGISGLVVQAAETPVALAVSRRRHYGIVRFLPAPVGPVVAILLMDYTLYLWHVLTHRVPLLWRFHRVHHADLDLDATTALRFHFGEMALSVPFRAFQVAVIGIDPRTFRLWQTLLFASILFHHSNIRLPLRLESVLRRIVMTPRLHGIHHSDRETEINSNWSSGLTCWDWLHGTLRNDVSQATIRIGVPEFRLLREVELVPMLALPFRDY